MAEFRQQQTDIFDAPKRQGEFSELCNALYERELHTLAQSKTNNINLLQRRIGGLSHHIKRTAERLLALTSPLTLDIHNGSWQAKQTSQCPGDDTNTELAAWLQQYLRPGLVLPVKVSNGMTQIELDSVDRIDLENSRVHLNKHGWFNLEGDALDLIPTALRAKHLLKPNKRIFTAACCGHCWTPKGKSLARALSLRELLLSTELNWKHFH